MEGRNGALRVNRVDVAARRLEAVDIAWHDGYIVTIDVLGQPISGLPWLLPGFVDAHVHIESSLLPPAEFARLAMLHGTVATVSDPHEIANVLGLDGIDWMLANAARSPLRVCFGAPSCVPATPFESAGARLDAAAVAALLDRPGIGHLSEVMNFPGVLAGDPCLRAKIAAARARGLPIDGHAPGLLGDDAAVYAAAGITSDHECASLQEAEAKLAAGMSILIREGSAARNFDALHPLLGKYPGRVMFCTDDCHPDDLMRGHIDRLVARAIALGYDLFDVLRAACLTPQRHYRLDIGQLRPGDPMTGVLVDDLRDFIVRQTWIAGQPVAEAGRCLVPAVPCQPINCFRAQPLSADRLRLALPGGGGAARCQVIEVVDGQLLTRRGEHTLTADAGFLQPSCAEDVLLLAVLDRYRSDAEPARALVRGFGLQGGAIASSVAHDSHNVIGVGCDTASLAAAMNAVIASQGGLAVAFPDGRVEALPLPIAGLMSDQPGEQVAARYAALNAAAREVLGSPLRAPLMTLSFMALLVIPELKLSDRGLFDGCRFRFTEVVCPSAG